MRLLLATTNPAKFKEIARLLTPAGIVPVSFQEAGLLGGIAETGQTYLENAAAKALFWSNEYEGPVVAEDSGLEVEALGGKPGVHTARYGGDGLTDAQRYQKLLEEIAALGAPAPVGAGAAESGAPPGRTVSRAAAYRCVAALANGGNLIVSFSGSCQGEIAAEPRGTGGFGYDPVFFYPPLGKTFAELGPEEKDKVSHRGAAFRALAEHLKTRGLSP
jgi:XTP/dITP diphosphohydrolase